MAVYVDELINYGVTYGRAGPEWCHLTADSLEELHRFAQQVLGLQARYFQGPPKASMPHYDLTAGKRKQAVARGAVEVQGREHLRRLREVLRAQPLQVRQELQT